MSSETASIAEAMSSEGGPKAGAAVPSSKTTVTVVPKRPGGGPPPIPPRRRESERNLMAGSKGKDSPGSPPSKEPVSEVKSDPTMNRSSAEKNGDEDTKNGMIKAEELDNGERSKLLPSNSDLTKGPVDPGPTPSQISTMSESPSLPEKPNEATDGRQLLQTEVPSQITRISSSAAADETDSVGKATSDDAGKGRGEEKEEEAKSNGNTTTTRQPMAVATGSPTLQPKPIEACSRKSSDNLVVENLETKADDQDGNDDRGKKTPRDLSSVDNLTGNDRDVIAVTPATTVDPLPDSSKTIPPTDGVIEEEELFMDKTTQTTLNKDLVLTGSCNYFFWMDKVTGKDMRSQAPKVQIIQHARDDHRSCKWRDGGAASRRISSTISEGEHV